MERYRLSLDLGSTSIGWCILSLVEHDGQVMPNGIVRMGVRVFSDGRDPKSGTSNAVDRRLKRQMRRNRDRFIERRQKLIDVLIEGGLFPESESKRRALTSLDPYELRVRGLQERLELHELGRAIFHLNQRRGFKSNRKILGDDKEAGAIKEALREQQALMDKAGARTYGELLQLRRAQGLPVRSRLLTRTRLNAKGKAGEENYYEVYPSRELTERELELLWNTQRSFHGEALSDALFNKIRETIIEQRPLKRPVVGKCTYERQEDRAPRALPSVQRCRIYQELNHLHILNRTTQRAEPLTVEQRDVLASLLCRPKGKKTASSVQVDFDKMRKALKLGEDTVFSLESDRRSGLDADRTSVLLAHNDRFGPEWHEMTPEEQDAVVVALLEVDDEEELIQHLMERYDLDRRRAEYVAATPLPDQYARLGITATRKILEELKKAVIPYSEAVSRAGYASHSQFRTGATHERLPYYGVVLEQHVVPDPELGGHPAAPLEKRYGKVTNPSVHIALNQVRKVVNELIRDHGVPHEIHLEVLRDLKNSLKQKKEIEQEQKKNQDLNAQCRRELIETYHVKDTRENIQRLRLWNELEPTARRCIYTGEVISATSLFTPEVEIDHILPFSRTLDDGMANKILCKRQGNREKGDRTPFERWGATNQWQDILDRCAELPANKRWRFAEDAMSRFEKERDFLARHLTDSQYITRLARAYLASLYPPNEEHRVLCLPGRLTSWFLHRLGLDTVLDEINPARLAHHAPRGQKNRDDHRHHALDALVIGLMDRRFLRQAARLHARREREGVYKMLDAIPEPWTDFRPSVRAALDTLIVSHKLDHGIEGALHNETAYGFPKRKDPRGNAIHRILIRDLTANDIPKIFSTNLRARLVSTLTGQPHSLVFKRLAELDDTTGVDVEALEKMCGLPAKSLESQAKAALASWGLRRVRIIETFTLHRIKDRRTHAPYKGVRLDSNAYMDIYAMNGTWRHHLVTRLEANAPQRKEAGMEGTFIHRLYNRDMLEMEHGGRRAIYYIQKMSDKQIALAEHFEANADARTRDKDNPFRFVYKGNADALRKAKVRFLVITPAGNIRYLSDPPEHDYTCD